MVLDAKRIHTIFSYLCDPPASHKFFEHISDSVHWIVMGHSPLSGTYTSKQSFMEATISVLSNDAMTEPIAFDIVDFLVDSGHEGQEVKAAVELKARDGTRCKSGLEYDMTYCWVVRFDADAEMEKIVEIRTYLDTGLLERAVSRERERQHGQ